MKNEERLDVVGNESDDVFDPNRGKNFRDELAQTLKENRNSAQLSSGGRAEAKGRLDFEKQFDWRYDDAKKEHTDELKKRSEKRARLIADFLKREKDIPNREYRLSKQEALEAFRALDAAIRDGVTSFSDVGDTLPHQMIDELDSNRYDIPALREYVNSCAKKAGRLWSFYEERKLDGVPDEIGFEKFNASPRNSFTDYELKNGLTMEERREKLKKLFERFKLKK